MDIQNVRQNVQRTSQMVAQIWLATMKAVLEAEKAANLEVQEVLDSAKEATANILEALPSLARNEMVDRTGEFARCVVEMVKLIAQNEFFTVVEDENVPSRLTETYAKWKELAVDMGYFGPILWEVKAGFTLRTHAPLVGPCYGDFGYMQDWELVGDIPTTDCLVFFIPKAVGVRASIDDAIIDLAVLREKYGLPERHCDSFGSAALVSGLILAHFNLTGERFPNDCGMVRTSTIFSRDWLCVGSFDNRGLYCQNVKNSGIRRRGGIGAFPIGVEYTG